MGGEVITQDLDVPRALGRYVGCMLQAKCTSIALAPGAARQRGLDVPSNSDARQIFWAKHVDALHERYAPPRRRRPTGQANDR